MSDRSIDLRKIREGLAGVDLLGFVQPAGETAATRIGIAKAGPVKVGAVGKGVRSA
ncbi:MAG: hypothetical protein AB7P02_28225 [Alphaproteobacteria bacterium]